MPHIMLRPLALKRARGGRHNGALAHQNCVLERSAFHYYSGSDGNDIAELTAYLHSQNELGRALSAWASFLAIES